MKWPVLDLIHLYQEYYIAYNMPTIIYKNNNIFQNKNEYYLLCCNVRLRSSYLTVAVMEYDKWIILLKRFLLLLSMS